ncbi:hypothetical protein B005_0185 [Nocardiopsis alba ATCC BAA-2165]|uniref:Uncharacterized protein n=1 Tax=Nocardiopsis alba (strain ATCC BAA-2165 / BE74) TaxID=1205910 RepID=J7LHW4_NOCAA|nr:hypothetical protein B005_0185 [Nocardiopsis alba ATCC BAA-2165]
MHRREAVSVEAGGVTDPQGGGFCRGHGTRVTSDTRKNKLS